MIVDEEIHIKAVLMGNKDVGKTSINNAINDQPFKLNYKMTIGMDFNLKIYSKNDRKINLQLWDFGGELRFTSILPYYLPGTGVIILCYDITNKESFSSLNNWYKTIFEYINIDDVILVVVGNKVDLTNRQVSYKEGRTFAHSLKAPIFLETSAKTGESIHTLESIIIDEILKKFDSDALEEELKNKSKVTDILKTVKPYLFDSEHKILYELK